MGGGEAVGRSGRERWEEWGGTWGNERWETGEAYKLKSPGIRVRRT